MRHNQNMQMLFDEEEEERLIMMQQQQQQQQQHHMGGGEQQDAGKNSYRVSRRIRREFLGLWDGEILCNQKSCTEPPVYDTG